MKQQDKAIDDLTFQDFDYKISYQPKRKYVCPDASLVNHEFDSCPTPVDKTHLDETKYTDNQSKAF